MNCNPRFLVLLTATGRKFGGEGAVPALDRYDGPQYRMLRAHRNAGFLIPRVLVLSGSHGLVDGTVPVEWTPHTLLPFVDGARIVQGDLWHAASRTLSEALFRAERVVCLAARDYGTIYRRMLDKIEGNGTQVPAVLFSGGTDAYKCVELRRLIDEMGRVPLSRRAPA